MAPGTEYDGLWDGGHAGLQFPEGVSLLPEEDRQPWVCPAWSLFLKSSSPKTCSPALPGSGNGVFPS